MVDPTSDLEEDVEPEAAPNCANCGEPIVDAPDHRVLTWLETGTVEAAHFCDDDCRAAWEEDG